MSAVELTVTDEPFEATTTARAELRIDATVLRPLLPGGDDPDPDAEYLAVALGEARIVLGEDGDLDVDVSGAVSLPRCMIAETGVIVAAGALSWLTPSSDSTPDATPPGFTGLFLDDVTVEIPGLPLGDGVAMQDVFLGTGGFAGRVALIGLDLTLDADGADGDLAGRLLGFHGGLTTVELSFAQSQLTGCAITGDVWLPFIDAAVGVDVGLTGARGITVTVGAPHTTTSSPAPDGFLVRADVAHVLTVDVAALLFTSDPQPAVTVDGRVTIDVDVLDLPPVTLTGLTIAADGTVLIEGGWVEVDEALAATVGGVGFEVTRIGFGTDDGRRWVGLDGGVRLAAGLPVGASVEGMRVSWDPDAGNVAASVRVAFDGIGVELAIDGVMAFKGVVALTEIDGHPAFRGEGRLTLPALDLTVEVGLVIGTAGDDTFFYFHLAVELPVGIPLFTTGTAIYGLAGLVAHDMGPDRDPDSPWYDGWYARSPAGVVAPDKWTVEPGAFAVGVGATVGTAGDDGYAFHARTLLVLLLPGPVVLLSGRGDVLQKRGAGDDPAFEALMVLDVPGKRFEATLAASYEVPVVFEASGTIDVAFSWAADPPPDVWHVYLGERLPEASRVGAKWLKVLQAEAWLMVDASGIDLGGWTGIDEHYRYGPVSVTVDVGIGGRGAVSWQPLQFTGELTLGGTVEVRAFGIGVTLTAEATVTGTAPAPWWLRIELEAGIEVDLLIKEFSWSTTIVLEWGDRTSPLPEPVDPVIETVAFEHLHARVDLPTRAGRPVPADVRPVVVFARPVADPGGVGAPVMSVRPDRAGDVEMTYELAHVVLRRGGRVVAAAGVGQRAGASLDLAGFGDPAGVDGASITVDDSDTTVAAVHGTALTLAGGAGGDGSRGYRLTAAPTRFDVDVVAVRDAPRGAYKVEIDRDLGTGDGLAGGALTTVDGGAHLVLDVAGDVVVVRPKSSAPVAGRATLTTVRPPELRGQWQIDSDDPAPTRLMLWARTPFAWWRSNSRGTLRELADSGVACGPTPTESLSCAPITPELLDGPKDATIVADTAGPVRWWSAPDGATELRLGSGGASGSFTVAFHPPVDVVEVHARVPAVTGAARWSGGEAAGRRDGHEVARAPLADGTTRIEGPLDAVTVTGINVALLGLCWAPGWHCVDLAALDVAPGSTAIAAPGLDVSTDGALDAVPGALRARAEATGWRPVPDMTRWELPGGIGGVGGRGSGAPFVGMPASERPALGELVHRGEVRLVLDPSEPVTRVRVRLASPATVEAIGPHGTVATRQGAAGDEVELRTDERWIDRIVVSGDREVRVASCCYDTGDLGWQRQAQLRWQDSIERTVEELAAVDDVLAPGDYELELVARVVTDAGGAPVTAYQRLTRAFTIGPPPGLGASPGADAGYPDGGPLAQLATYVRASEPAPGAVAVYRSHDIGVAFAEPYVDRLYAQAGVPLHVRVRDATGAVVRKDDPNVWGTVSHELTRTEEAWAAAIEIVGGCASIDAGRIARDETVRAGGGVLLAADRLHVAELVAGERAVHQIAFVTSRFADASHQLTSGTGRLRTLEVGVRDLRPALATPDVRGARFAAVMDMLGLPVHRQRLATLEVTRVAQGLLVDSPEPLHMDRLVVEVTRHPWAPRRRRTLRADRREVREPDVGGFEHGGLAWHTDRQLRIRDGALLPVGDGDWTLTVDATGLHEVEVALDVGEGGHATLDGGMSGVDSVPAGTRGEVTLRVARPRGDVRLTTARARVLAVTVVEPFVPVAVAGALRIVEVRPPSGDGGPDHAVRIRSYGDVDVDGLALRWNDPLAQGTVRDYHRFAAEHLRDGDELEVRGAAAAAPRRRVRTGGTVGAPGAAGMVVSLVDGSGRTIHDAVGLRAGGWHPVAVEAVANVDETRLLLVDPTGDLGAGSLRLACTYRRSGGGLPVQSVGGDSSDERAALVLPPG
jgi:hypothetical protein